MYVKFKLTCRIAVEEVWMFAGQTVWTIIGGLAGLDTTMWVTDLVNVLSSKPIIKIVIFFVLCIFISISVIFTISTITVVTLFSIIVTGAPE